MFYPLPAETVFEAKQRTRRATVYLFLLLAALYVFFLDLLVAAAYFLFNLWLEVRFHDPASGLFSGFRELIFYSTLAAVALSLAHFAFTRHKSLDGLLDQIKARPADPKDNYHAQFINLVEEAEAATGIHGIRAVVIATPGCNAFSLQDGHGRCAIGTTEGLLSKLTRPELSAVVAHEAAHLVHEDSQLVTTACFLFAVFGDIHSALGAALRGSSYSSSDRRSSSRGGGVWGILLALWLISGLGYLVTKLISMAISREREYLADADGVQMCKDPISLAEGLFKISRRYRGDTPDTYSSLFILNPGESGLDDKEGFVAGLFSNHPPVSRRLSKLLAWAKSDIQDIRKKVEREEAAPGPTAVPAADPAAYLAYRDSQWVGPYTPPQLLAMGLMTPSNWVCPQGSQQVARVSELPEFQPLLLQQVQGSVSENACPRCKVPMVRARYEGADVDQCAFCNGYLLRAGVLERMIVREEAVFSQEEIRKSKVWRDSQRGPLKDRDHFPDIRCPLCKDPMCKSIHSMLTQVVIDHCSNHQCGAIWCDGGELETIQILVEDAHKVRV